MSNRIKDLREARGWSQERLASLLGTHKGQISKLEKGERRLSQDWMERIAAALEVPVIDLITRRGSDLASLSSEDAMNETFLTLPPSTPAPAANVTVIDELDVRASAGPGVLNADSEAVVAQWSLPSDLLQSQTSAPSDTLKIITIYGDSMEPLFRPGERVLVDTSDRAPSPPGVFVVWDGFGQVIKRLEMIPYSDPPVVRLKSANPAYDPYELPLASVHINGRVIGKWQWT